MHNYVRNNYDRIELTVKPKGRKEEIKAHAEQQGETLNSFINRAIEETIERDNSGEAPGSTPESAGEENALALSSITLETAQAAANATGENERAFIQRAVAEQAKRDVAALRMGINPAK